MDNTIQLYLDEKEEIKGYPITSPDRVIDENGVNIKERLDNIVSQLPDDLATKDYVEEAINNAKLEGGNTQADLSDYAKKTDLHDHSNKTILDSITSEMTTKWNKSIPFEDSAVNHANSWLTNGYAKTSTSTGNLPSVCTGNDRWGVLFFLAENSINKTGTQMYFPIDGTYKGRIFTRSVVNGSSFSDWFLLSTFDGNYNNLTNKPTSLPANGGNANTVGGYSLWVGTQAQYDAIATKSNTTVYIIKEG